MINGEIKMKIKKQVFLTAIFVIIGLLSYNYSNSIDSITSLDISSKDISIQFGDLLIDENEEIVSVLVYLKDQVDLDAINIQMDQQGATLKDRHEKIVVALQSTAFASQLQIVEYLGELESQKLVKDFECFWIGNIIRVDTYQSVVDQIALRDDVLWVYPNYEIALIEPVDSGTEGELVNRDEIEPGVVAVRAPEVWEEFNITGEGVLVATIDSGVDGDHPALADRWAGVADPRYEGHPEWAWFDPYAGQNDFPYDIIGHGTHTMGSVCGGSPGDQIGVAPGALWISAGLIQGSNIPQFVEDAIEALEWIIDPDGNPETNWDVPDVCSNSWGLNEGIGGVPPCDETFWTFLDACEAAGIVIIFSAGNEGYAGLRRPPDRATDDYRTFAVAAVDANDPTWPIAGFSSRGPTFCTPNGTEAIKPDIAAPGVQVRSSVPGGGYSSMSGTSMASPHVNGVVALMRQVSSNIGVQEIKQIIFDTAYDLGDGGEDNDYGWGMVDAYEAVLNTNLPPDIPQKPSGESEGVTKLEYTFSTTTIDPEGERILYKFNWGDNTTSEWLGPFDSGATVNAVHAWSDEGYYNITVKAMDVNGSVSGWSDPHSIHILKAPYIRLFKVSGGFLTVNSIIKNLGEVEANNVEWNVDIAGGIILYGKESSGVITCIPAYGEMTVESKPIIGFGQVTITVQAMIPENTAEKTNMGFVYLFFIQVNPSG
jgi:subtilisin family serine protease